MKYVDYKKELKKPENREILNKIIEDFRNYLENESNGLAHYAECGFDYHQFWFMANHQGEHADQELHSVWHCWLTSNGFKYLGLQHQRMFRGFCVYAPWDNGSFFANDGDMYLMPIPEKTLINDYEFMKGVLEKAKAAYPQLNWQILDVQIEWRKA